MWITGNECLVFYVGCLLLELCSYCLFVFVQFLVGCFYEQAMEEPIQNSLTRWFTAEENKFNTQKQKENR